MSAAELLNQINLMPEAERGSIFACLIANGEWRQDYYFGTPRRADPADR